MSNKVNEAVSDRDSMTQELTRLKQAFAQRSADSRPLPHSVVLAYKQRIARFENALQDDL